MTRDEWNEELPHDLELEVDTSYGIDEGGDIFTVWAYGLKMGSTVNEVVAMWLRREPCHSTGQGLGNERLDPPASLAWDGITHVP